jgi:hypothetical protein
VLKREIEAGDLSSPLDCITSNTDTNTVPTPATQSTSGAVVKRAHEEGASNAVAKKGDNIFLVFQIDSTC